LLPKGKDKDKAAAGEKGKDAGSGTLFLTSVVNINNLEFCTDAICRYLSLIIDYTDDDSSSADGKGK
jgi:hypothetical protein